MDQEKTGKFIARMRREKEMTQAQLGERLGVTNKTVSRWETGKYMPDISMLSDLSRELGITVNELLSGERLPDNMELTDNTEMVSQYSRLLLHEKERTAVQINKMLKKGFQILPKNRYQNVEEMLSDLKKLTDILNGTDRKPLSEGKVRKTGVLRKKHFLPAAALMCAVFLAAGVGAGVLLERTMQPQQSMEHTELDLTQFPLETDDSVVLTEKNIRHLSLRPQPRNMSRNRYGHPEMHSPNAPHRSASA